MKKVEFFALINCNTGWEDNEEVGELRVGTFNQVLEFAEVLKKNSRVSERRNMSLDEKELLEYCKKNVKVPSGQSISFLGTVQGIKGVYEDEKGTRAELSIDDDYGVDGSIKVNNEKYNNEYKRKLKEAKNLAIEIAKL